MFTTSNSLIQRIHNNDPTLTSAAFQGNYQIGAGEVQALAAALKVNFTLTAVNVDNNQIGAAGALALAEALKSNHTLTAVNLNINQISDAALEQIKILIDYNAQLRDQLHQAINSTELARVQAFITQLVGYIELRNQLHQAFKTCYLARVQALIAEGASLLAPSKAEGHTSLHWVVLSQSPVNVSAILQAMKAKRLPLTMRNNEGKTAQALAANYPEIVKLFTGQQAVLGGDRIVQ